MLSIKRSVERVEHVQAVSFKLKTGIASVAFKPSGKPDLALLWRAIKESGFTPVKIESNGEVYQGPE